jgi:hypothetical protein
MVRLIGREIRQFCDRQNIVSAPRTDDNHHEINFHFLGEKLTSLKIIYNHPVSFAVGCFCGIRDGRPGVGIPARTRAHAYCGAHSVYYLMCTVVVPRGVKRPAREDVKNEYLCSSNLPV